MQLGKTLGPGEPIWKYPHFECQTHAVINNILALLPRCLSNFKTIGRVWTWISRLRDFTRSCGKSSVRLVNRGPVHIEAWWRKYVSVTGLPLVHIMACHLLVPRQYLTRSDGESLFIKPRGINLSKNDKKTTKKTALKCQPFHSIPFWRYLMRIPTAAKKNTPMTTAHVAMTTICV